MRSGSQADGLRTKLDRLIVSIPSQMIQRDLNSHKAINYKILEDFLFYINLASIESPSPTDSKCPPPNSLNLKSGAIGICHFLDGKKVFKNRIIEIIYVGLDTIQEFM